MAKKKTVKKATRPAKKATKATRTSEYTGTPMPQKSAATKKGGARPVGVKSGVGVTATWVACFERNAKASKKNRMTNEEITKEMNRNFPGRNSAVFNNVTGVRSAFIREGKLDHIECLRYDENGDVIEKGKRKVHNGSETSTPPPKKAKKAKRPVKKK